MFFPIITFPGVMLHEFSHALFCRLLGLKVFKIAFFRFGSLSGYVEHEAPDSLNAAFWVSMGPLVINSLVCFGLAYAAAWQDPYVWKYPVLIWLAFSFGSQALPSDQDARNIVDKNKTLIRDKHFLYLLAFPFYYLAWLIVWASNKLKLFAFDVIYASLLILVGLTLK